MHTPLLGKTLSELQEVAKEFNLKPFVAKQLADWIYKKRVTSIDEMTNISLNARAAMADKYSIGRFEPIHSVSSADGTVKYLFPTTTPKHIESVYIPEPDRATLCVSTQVGCKMACKFCATGNMHFHGQLTATEILNQIFSIPNSESLSNLVFMGMGEPFDNTAEVMRALEIMTADYACAWSPSRITVSTVGIWEGLKKFLGDSRCHLAISLHNPFAAGRLELMPIEKKYSLEDTLNLIRQYDFKHQRRVSFEYILFDGVNDTMRHAVEIVKVLRGIPCRINIIKYHDSNENELKSSSDEKINFFKEYLNNNGIITTIRKSRGEDILAACGMLASNGELS